MCLKDDDLSDISFLFTLYMTVKFAVTHSLPPVKFAACPGYTSYSIMLIFVFKGQRFMKHLFVIILACKHLQWEELGKLSPQLQAVPLFI